MTKSKRYCLRCNHAFIDGGAWAWCQNKKAWKLKYYRGDSCDGCKYFKRERADS